MSKAQGRKAKDRAAKVKAGAETKAEAKAQMAHKRARGVI